MSSKFFNKTGVLAVCLCLPTLSHAMWDTSDPHRFAGDVLQLALPATGLVVAYHKDDMQGAKQLGKTMAATVITTEALKTGFNNTALGKRPNGGSRSFPSGHTSSACAGATFIGQRYGWKAGLPAMGVAGYVGWTRVHAKAHHPRDVVAGCAVGVAAGLLLTDPMSDTQVLPWYENKTLGVSVSSVW